MDLIPVKILDNPLVLRPSPVRLVQHGVKDAMAGKREGAHNVPYTGWAHFFPLIFARIIRLNSTRLILRPLFIRAWRRRRLAVAVTVIS